MSILLYNFKGLTKSIEEVERIEDRVNSKKKEWLTKKKKGEEREEQEKEKERLPTTLDSYFIKNKANFK